jgi:hypothetical protein
MNKNNNENMNGKFLVVDSSNIGQILEQMIKQIRKTPAQQMRQCFGCKQIMANQAYSMMFVGGVPQFYCEICSESLSCG